MEDYGYEIFLHTSTPITSWFFSVIFLTFVFMSFLPVIWLCMWNIELNNDPFVNNIKLLNVHSVSKHIHFFLLFLYRVTWLRKNRILEKSTTFFTLFTLSKWTTHQKSTKLSRLHPFMFMYCCICVGEQLNLSVYVGYEIIKQHKMFMLQNSVFMWISWTFSIIKYNTTFQLYIFKLVEIKWNNAYRSFFLLKSF